MLRMNKSTKTIAERIRSLASAEKAMEAQRERTAPQNRNPRRFHSFLSYDGDLDRYMVDLDHGIRWKCSTSEQLNYPYVSSIGFRITANPAWSWGLKEVEPREARRLIADASDEPSPYIPPSGPSVMRR